MAEYTAQIPVDEHILNGDLTVPRGSRAIVIFAHGSGSSRHSPRNQYVAKIFQQAGLSTLLLDLLTRDEEKIDIQTRHLRFDIHLLARRVVAAIDWVGKNPFTKTLRVGLFGASTGAAAALIAAAQRPMRVKAVVSRGGRPELAGDALPTVRAPTLLIVGGHDEPVIRLNHDALAALQSHKELMVIPGATHLFEESGALERAAVLAQNWFMEYLVTTHEFTKIP